VETKQIIIGVIALIIIAVPLYIFILKPGDDTHTHLSEDGQLYTCGMHPEIISDEPGVCPICEMNLTPIKNSNQKKNGERKIIYWRALKQAD
jgi:Cu(I)/Ag(I) efflux system membrane fusion protein/cobalt-zinc-cadmium efflux system membrane fusion protein